MTHRRAVDQGAADPVETDRVNVGTVAVSVAGLPAGVAFANHFGWGVTFSVLAVLGMVAAAVGVTFPSMHTARPTSTSPAASARASTTEPMHAQVAILREPAFQGHLLLSAMLFTAMFTAYAYLAAFLQIVAALEGGGVALALMGFGAAGLVGNWIAGRVVERLPIATTAAVAAALMVTTAALSLVGGRGGLLWPVLGVWGAIHAAAFVACQVRVMLAGDRSPAFAMSLNISACNLGIAGGAVIGAWIVERYGVVNIGVGSAVVAAGALAATLASWRMLLQATDATGSASSRSTS